MDTSIVVSIVTGFAAITSSGFAILASRHKASGDTVEKLEDEVERLKIRVKDCELACLECEERERRLALSNHDLMTRVLAHERKLKE